MTGYVLSVTCLHCGSLLEHTAGSKPHSRLQSVVAACTSCGSQYRLNVELLVLNGPAIRETLPSVASVDPARGRRMAWPTFDELAQPEPSKVLAWQAEVDAVLAADDVPIARARRERKRLNSQEVAA